MADLQERRDSEPRPRQPTGIDDIERAAGHAVKRVQVVVRPSAARGAPEMYQGEPLSARIILQRLSARSTTREIAAESARRRSRAGGADGGQPLASTLANGGPATEGTLEPFTVTNLALLKQGANTMAVEVHQNANTSSDVVFGMKLISSRATSKHHLRASRHHHQRRRIAQLDRRRQWRTGRLPGYTRSHPLIRSRRHWADFFLDCHSATEQ